jgi:hypothetical protein
MAFCLNPNDPNVKRMVKDFGESKVSNLIQEFFNSETPTYEEFIKNKNVKEALGLIPISKVKEEIGKSFPKEISDRQKNILFKTISTKNNYNKANNISIVYMAYNVERIGQADLNTWGLRKVKGNLDIDAKIERAKSRVVDAGQSNAPVSELERLIKNNEHLKEEVKEKTPQELFLEEEARKIQEEDARRAGIDYTDDYLFGRNTETELKVDPNITEAEFKRQVDLVNRMDAQETSLETLDNQNEKAIEIATTLADKLSTAMNVEWELVTPEAAEILLKNTATEYAGEPAFFFGNKVYFVEGNLSVDNVLHEFAHPLIKGIEQENPELFEKLYSDLVLTPEGIDLINYIEKLYPKLQKGTKAFMREALVTSIERKGTAPSPAFKKFLDKIMFAIKKIIRKVFSPKVAAKINLNKLSQSTTLDELANMLANEEFEIETFEITDQDIAEFKKIETEISRRISELRGVPVERLQEEINRVYDNNMRQLNALKQVPFKVKDLLVQTGGTKILNYISEELSKYQNINVKPENVDPENVIRAVEDIENETRLRSLALINSLNEIKTFVESIEKILNDLEKVDTQTNENISRVVYYKSALQDQLNLIDKLKDLPLDKETLFFRTLNSIQNSIEQANKKIKKIEFKFISDFFSDETELMQGNIEKNLKERVGIILKAEGYSEKDINTFVENVINSEDRKTYKLKDLGLTDISSRRANLIVKAVNEYLFKRLGKQQIEEYLNGERGDMSFYTAFITPYANMDDPIAGSFTRFIKSKVFEAEQEAQNQADQITYKLLPLLNAVGYQPYKTNQLGDMLLFLDKTAYIDNNGDFQEKEVWTFKNKFKNYRYDLAKLEHNFDIARKNNDKQAMKDAYQAIQDFEEKYMHRRYTKAFYDIQKIWNTGAIVTDPFTGKEINVSPKVSFDAYVERQNALSKMNTLKNVNFLDLEDLYDFNDSEEQARLEYNRLFDIYTLEGKEKKGEELERVLIRKKHRELSRNMYDYDTDTERIQKDLDNFNNRLLAKGLDPEAEPKEGETKNEYQKEMDRFFRANFKIAYTSKFYSERKRILDDIRKITEKVANKKSQVALDLAELYKTRFNLSNSTSDANGQPNGLNLSPEQINLLKKIEDEIVRLEEQFDRKTGLTKEQTARYDAYIAKSAAGVKLTEEERKDYAEILGVKNEMGLNTVELALLKSRFAELRELESKVPTDYYLEAFNYAIRDLELPEININNADNWINSNNLTKALENPEFAKWFGRNHYQKEVFDLDLNGKVVKNFRTSVWTMKVPNNPDHYFSTTMLDPFTKEEITVPGRPAGKYTKSKIKNEYLTIPRGEDREKYVGTIIDNRGNYLPREYKVGDLNSAFDRKYQNEEYEEMKNAGGPEFELLNAVTESMLQIQKNKPLSSRLYLEMPRFRRRSNLEYIQSGEAKENILDKVNGFKGLWKTWFGKDVDDAEYGFNHDVNYNLVSTDLEGHPVSKVKIRGLYNLDQKVVSKDVLRGMYDYLLSLEEQKVLLENEPIAEALKSVLDENGIKDLSRIEKEEFKRTGKKKYPKKKSNKRLSAIDYYIDKVFYGKSTGAFDEEHPFTTKLVQGLFRRSSRAFIAFDPQSAIKNRWGMLYQNAVYAAGGKNVTPTSLAKGYAKAKQSAMYWVFKDVYEQGVKSPDVQLIERMDPTAMFEKNFGKSSSRSKLKDLADLTYAYDFRRTMELEAALEIFWGIMYNKYIPQAGSAEDISYAEAWETDDKGILKLKDGIDPAYDYKKVEHEYKLGDTFDNIAKRYNITPEQVKERSGITDLSRLEPGDKITVGNMEEFLNMKFLQQSVQKKTAGLMDRFDSPQAEKYLIYRAFTFYKRFATGMFLDKYQIDTDKGNIGGYVYNWDTNELTKGYYMNTLQNTLRLLKSVGRDTAIMTEDEKIAVKRAVVEGVGYFLMAMIIGSWYFGYDSDDEDKWKKLKRRGKTIEGQLENHLLYLLIMTRMENQAFFPTDIFKQGTRYFKTTTIALDNTVVLYTKIGQDLYNIAAGDENDARYSQDIGPYSWQRKGEYKLWNHLGSIYGIKGKNALDIGIGSKKAKLNEGAIWAIKKYEAFENLQ